MRNNRQDLINGIDVSHWQGEIDFEKVKNAGYPLVYLKATENTSFVDPRFYNNFSKAKRNGMKVGVYHFFRPKVPSTAVEQAKHFTDVINGLDVDLLLALDIETTGGLTRQQITDQCLVFLEEVQKRTGLGTVVYTYNYFAQEYLDDRLGVYPVWIADYYDKELDNPIWDEWVGYQYTDKGSVPGIDGPVDLNYFKEGIFLPKEEVPDVEALALYTIGSGDTLYNLARVFKTTPQAIANLNNISVNKILFPGEKLIVNAALFLEPYSKVPDPITYIVQPGDSLFSIAKRFNTTVNELIRLNDIIDPTLIFPGQVLIVG